MKTLDMKCILKTVMASGSLTENEAQLTMTGILNGETFPEQVGALLSALQFRAPTANELVGFVKAIQLQSPTFLYENAENILDVCGTGGDGLGTFNVSTTVAFVVAATGQDVAKHGNRAVSSRCGSFDVLEALDIPFATTLAEATMMLEKFSLSFLYAPAFYPVLQKLGPVRRNLGVKTIFNALGPLLNPLKVGRQLIGVYAESLLFPMAEASKKLGAKEVLIVWGEDGLDEFSIDAGTRTVHFKNGDLVAKVFQPIERGSVSPFETGLHNKLGDLGHVGFTSIAGAEPKENANLLLGVLKGTSSCYREITVLNAAAALMVGGKVGDLREGRELAIEMIDSGRALALLIGMQSLKNKRLA